MPVARKAALALCAIAALAIAALLFAAPPAAYADDGWTYDPVEHTLANDSGVVLNNVTADDSGNLTIEGTVLHPALNQGFAGSLDLTGAVKGTGGKTYLITAIGENAFKDCASLESVAIPDGVKTIGRWAFYSCTSLESVAIPDGVESTGSRAFQECRALASVAILGGVGSIGGYAFLGCASLERVAILAATPPTLGDWAFSGCAARLAIVVPAGSLEAYEGDIDWSSLNLKAGYPLKVNGKALPGLYAEGDEVAAPEGVGVGDGQHAKWTLEGEGGQAATVMYGTLEMPGRDAKATCTAEPHTFSGRYCTACGATNPDYVPPAPTYAVEVATTECWSN